MAGKRGLIRRVCFFCGETFYAQNPTAKFHSANCRLKAFRWRKRIVAHEKHIHAELSSLTEYLNYDDSRAEAASTIAALLARFEKVMRDGNIRRVK